MAASRFTENWAETAGDAQLQRRRWWWQPTQARQWCAWLSARGTMGAPTSGDGQVHAVCSSLQRPLCYPDAAQFRLTVVSGTEPWTFSLSLGKIKKKTSSRSIGTVQADSPAVKLQQRKEKEKRPEKKDDFCPRMMILSYVKPDCFSDSDESPISKLFQSRVAPSFREPGQE